MKFLRIGTSFLAYLLIGCTAFGMESQHAPVKTTATSTDIGQQLTYGEVAKQNLKSMTGKGKFKIPLAAAGDVGRFIERQKGILLNIDDNAKTNTVFTILADNEKNKTTPHSIPNSIIDKTTWQDLGVLNGSDKNPGVYLGSILNKTSTALGKAYLLGTIARPIANTNRLEKRQKIVKSLVLPKKNNVLLNELDAHLKEMADGEAQLLSFWNKDMQLPGTIRNQYYRFNEHVDGYLNNSRLALDAYSVWTNTKKGMGLAIKGSSALLLPTYALFKLYNATLAPEEPSNSDFLEHYAAHFTGTEGPMYAVLSAIPWLQSGAAGTVGIMNILSLKSAVAWAKADFSVDAILQKKLVYIAKYVNQMKAIHGLLQHHPELTVNLENFAGLQECVNSKNENLNKLFTTLASNTFSAESNYYFSRGNVLLAYKLLEDETVQTELEKGCAAIAEIDMFASCAKLYNQFKNKRVQFCFPTYLENKETPFIKLKNYWNPFVDPETVVENSTTLGQDEQSRNTIITGPNSAGKSTVLKSIALSIVLAQSIGIAPAKSMSFTPFHHVATYMDIADDISNKTSLFQSEVDRAIKLQKRIKDLPEGTFSFSMFDELFSGTSPDEGMAMAYATAEALGQLPNSICMIATHYKLLTDLETKTKNFTNYQVSVAQDAGGIKRLYKLERNSSNQHIALDVARERGFKDNIIDRASDILKQLTK